MMVYAKSKKNAYFRIFQEKGPTGKCGEAIEAQLLKDGYTNRSNTDPYPDTVLRALKAARHLWFGSKLRGPKHEEYTDELPIYESKYECWVATNDEPVGNPHIRTVLSKVLEKHGM